MKNWCKEKKKVKDLYRKCNSAVFYIKKLTKNKITKIEQKIDTASLKKNPS